MAEHAISQNSISNIRESDQIYLQHLNNNPQENCITTKKKLLKEQNKMYQLENKGPNLCLKESMFR